MGIFIAVVLIIILVAFLYMQHPIFGARATGNRLKNIKASPNYKNGAFNNRSLTPRLAKGYSYSKLTYDFIFRRIPGKIPKGSIPAVQTNLKSFPEGDWLVWFGHSSYFVRINEINFLIDPVFSGNASPIPRSTKSFKGSDLYTADDMPEIDYLLITHDHYDHLDYDTVKKLKVKVKKVICGLGVGAHLEHWGYASEKIIELDWDSQIEPQKDVKLFAFTARHFSGRTFRVNTTLWMSFLLQTPTHKIFIGGDSGYDNHFKVIGDLHGPIDLAVLENGQYNLAWNAIHFLPGENLQAAIDLKAKRLMPVHSSKFAIAMHQWDEPLNEMVKLNQRIGLPLVTPKIGEVVDLNNSSQVFSEWWKDVDVT